MKTTIPINGLDVEFSNHKPTRPGAYWYLAVVDGDPSVMEVCKSTQGRLFVLGEGDIDASWHGLWSAPLVPVTEVEKAYKEGHWHGSQEVNEPHSIKRVVALKDYGNSNARKVVEGVS